MTEQEIRSVGISVQLESAGTPGMMQVVYLFMSTRTITGTSGSAYGLHVEGALFKHLW